LSRKVAMVIAMGLMAVTTGAAGITGAAGAAKPKGTTLLIGWLGSETSAASAGEVTLTPDTLKAWENWTNAHGGIAGHPVKVVFEPDDKADPAEALADATDLINNKKVIAIVGESSESEGTWAPLALQQRVPVIGSTDTTALEFTNPMFYSVGATVLTDLWGEMRAAKEAGVKRVGVLLCTEDPACAEAQPAFRTAAQENGLDMVYDALASDTQVSYTAECLAAKQAGVQALAAYVNDVVLGRDCVRQGFHALWVQAGNEGENQIKLVSAFGNTVGASYVWNCNGPEYAQTAAFNEAMAKYQPRYDKGTALYKQEGAGDCKAWAAGMAFAKAVENADVAPTAQVTRADVIRGLSKFHDETLDGYLPNITYGNGTKPNPQETCDYLYKYKGLQYIPEPKGVNKFTCEPTNLTS
jgi:branched-chain amino acid transport system substrate-binding protein